MTWILVDSDGNESDEIDSKPEAKDQKQSMEQLGKEVELREVESDRTVADSEAGDLDAEIIEMSRQDGGNSTDTDDDERDDIELVGDGSGRTRVYCPACGRFSTKIYRCSGCGHDLAGETVDEWGDDA